MGDRKSTPRDSTIDLHVPPIPCGQLIPVLGSHVEQVHGLTPGLAAPTGVGASCTVHRRTDKRGRLTEAPG
jgi:hypothetical protein